MRANWIHTGYPVSQNTLSFIAATHTNTTFGTFCMSKFFLRSHWHSTENGSHSFVVFIQWLSSAHTQSYLFYYSLRWYVNSIEYHPGSLMGLDFSIIMDVYVYTIYTYLYAQCQNIHTSENLNWTAKEKGMRMCGWEWVSDRAYKRAKRVGAFGSCLLHQTKKKHKTEARPRGKPSIRIAHTSSAKLSIPRKVVSVLWKWTTSKNAA